MTGTASPAADTRRRLLDAAQRLFTERGYAKVTVRDITGDAHANLAAVSYHFRDKLGLYREVLQRGLRLAQEVNAETMLSRTDHTAEECLRHYVRQYLPRVVHADARAWIHQILRHEMADPTPAARWYVQQAIMPRVEFLVDVVRDLFGDSATPDRVQRCVTSIQAQCLFYLPDPFKSMVMRNWQPRTDEEIRDTAEHITEFSLAGIRAIANVRRGPRVRAR
ncbi:MAG: CerR family C-terminal domain-containing protein [Gemmatimonadaceae bacterium]|nr:CerR family C-terminal domain-containing protein [Gemmatimonadaceae bacterium]